MPATTRRTLLHTLPLAAAAAALSAKTQADAPLTIGIIGAGHVGATLGGLWTKAGIKVMLSARALDEARATAQSLGPLASAGTPQDAARFGSVIVLAVPYGAIPAVGSSIGALVAGKTVLDATNPYSFRDGGLAATAQQNGAGVTTQRYFPSAHVVRGFNSIDMSRLGDSAGQTPPIAIPIAGDDAASIALVKTLVTRAGFAPVVTGGLATATLFQPGHPGFELCEPETALRKDLGL